MIRTQRILLRDAWTGQTLQEVFVHRDHAFCGVSHVAHSRLLVCPTCKQVWAILQFVDEVDCWPVGQYCERCGGTSEWNPVPGSLLFEEAWGVIDDALLHALPDNLVEREFKLHLEAYKS